MADEHVDKPETAPAGTTEARSGAAEDYAGKSFEELEALAKGEELTPEPKEPEIEEPKGEEPEAEPKDSDLPADLKDKSPEELARMYANLREMQSKQANELGELRQYRKQQEELQQQMRDYSMDATARQMVTREVRQMSAEERTKFYDRFAEDPEAALMPMIENIMRPVLLTQARTTNESEVQRLREQHKDSLVPYNEDEVNRVIASFNRNGRNELFDQYGSGAFEYAYNLYFQRHANGAMERRLKELTEQAKAEAEAEARTKVKTFSEPGSPSPPGGTPNYENMPFEELEKVVERTR